MGANGQELPEEIYYGFTNQKIMIHTKTEKNTVTAKPKIRVIKKGEISRVEMPIFVNKLPKKEVARQMIATVMNWVSDFETRKIEETRLAIERFQHM